MRNGLRTPSRSSRWIRGEHRIRHPLILPVFGEAAKGEVADAIRWLTEGLRHHCPSTPTPAVSRSPSPFGVATRGGSGWRDTLTGPGWQTCSVFARARSQAVAIWRADPARQPQKRGNVGLARDADHRLAIDHGPDQPALHPCEQLRICHLPQILARAFEAPRPGRGQHPVPRIGKRARLWPCAQAIGARAAHPDMARRHRHRSGEIELREKGTLARHAPPVGPRAQRHGAEPAGAAAQTVGMGLRHRAF